jgi:dsDNA-specific endonuclease/ATPase MutS2
MRIIRARHPLLDGEVAVPLDFALGDGVSGVVVTGPNTGGKTVAIKTVGLLTLMAQSGLHVPADERSVFCLRDAVLCDIGDGQSIAENLSTFSSHMKNIIENTPGGRAGIARASRRAGLGTDPAEGWGWRSRSSRSCARKNCLFAVTTHYPGGHAVRGREAGALKTPAWPSTARA